MISTIKGYINAYIDFYAALAYFWKPSEFLEKNWNFLQKIYFFYGMS